MMPPYLFSNSGSRPGSLQPSPAGSLLQSAEELSIRNLAARFTDAVNERDIAAFRQLWTDDPVWEIGPPLQSRAEGVDEIAALLSRLLQAEQYFMQMTHSGEIGRASCRERVYGLV